MSRLFIGHKPGVGGVVKVMRYNSDDPLTTPNEHYGKFLFNSENTKLAYVKDITSYKFDPSITSDGIYYYPPGSNYGNALRRLDRNSGTNVSFQRNFIVPGRIVGRGDIPIVAEMRHKKPFGEERWGPFSEYVEISESWDYIYGENETHASYVVDLQPTFGRSSPTYDLGAPVVCQVWRFEDNGRRGAFFDSSGPNNETICSILDLPAANNPMPSASAGTSGTRNTLITPSLVRIGKAGVNADSGGDNVIADSTAIPLKVVRTGQVDINAGSYVDVSSPWPLSENAYLDYIAWRAGEPLIWPEPISGVAYVGDWSIRITYAVYPDKVRIYNRGSVNTTVRYLICSDDTQTTTGGNTVFRRLPDGNIQIKRPGSSDTAPKDGDIILDTRFSYLPIIAEGYVHRDSFTSDTSNRTLGDRKYTVTFPNDGSFVPYVKFYPYLEGGEIRFVSIATLRPRRIGSPCGWGTYDGWASSRNAVAQITNTSVTFWLATGHPYSLLPHSGGFNPDYRDSQRPLDIRYYIFALPVSF